MSFEVTVELKKISLNIKFLPNQNIHNFGYTSARDYQRTSSVTQRIKNLNWRSLEQRRIDSQLILMYKITYDLVAIPVPEYLIPNTRHNLANPSTQRLFQVHILPPHHTPLERPPFLLTVLPTVAQFSHTNQNQNCLLVTRQNDNCSPGP